ncbi:MAG: PhoU domain-containing protein [Ignisphaera sp.]
MLLIEELEKLKSVLLHMAKYTKDVIYKTSSLFEKLESSYRERIWSEIDNSASLLERIRKEFVNEVLVFIARRQPLGKELLVAHTLIGIAYDVYRISRYCREIARIDSMLNPESSLSDVEDIKGVFSEAVKAVEISLNDLISLEPINEATVIEIDNKVDEYYKKLLKEVVLRDSVDRLTALKILIMRHIERIVDHANYIENYLKTLA